MAEEEVAADEAWEEAIGEEAAEEEPEPAEVDEEELARLEAELAGFEGLEAEDAAEAPEAEAAPEDLADPLEELVDVGEDLDLKALLADVGEAAAVEGEAPEEDEEPEEDLTEGLDLDEDMKDSIEGSLRLKRLLSRDDDFTSGAAPKKRRIGHDPEKEKKVKALCLKWGLMHDRLVKHVLDGCAEEELDTISKSGYMPDKNNVWKSTAEILNKYVSELRERSMPGGAKCDAIAAFKHRWKLDFATANMLRALSHKELRYVLTHFDNSCDIPKIIEEAKLYEPPDDDNSTGMALLKAPGVGTIGRFTRLELIDPLADAAVFGDANLTFALRLARHRKALGHVGRVIATTFEEHETLKERYKEIDKSIETLAEMSAEVFHGVDCTKIATNSNFQGMEASLGAVYYNFPHSGAIGGFFDGHPVVNWRHENLMRLFFRALRSFMKPGGIVKVSSNMGATGVRYSYIVGSAIENEFLHVETVPFLEWHLHRYGRSYGDKRDIYKRPDAMKNQSYNAQAADRDMVYCFCYSPTGDTLPPQFVRLPPTLKTLQACTDGPFKNLQGLAKQNLAAQLHKRFVTEISGTHVG